MIESWISLVGVWFFAALAAETLAAFVSQAGAARSPDDEAPRSWLGRAHVLVGLLSPALLIAHAWLASAGADDGVRGLLVGAPITATIFGALLGSIFGAIAPGAAPTMRRIALIVALISLALAMLASYPSLRSLIA